MCFIRFIVFWLTFFVLFMISIRVTSNLAPHFHSFCLIMSFCCLTRFLPLSFDPFCETLNFSGKQPMATKRFIEARGRWSKASCHHIHNCCSGVKTSGCINFSRYSWGIDDATSIIFCARVGIVKGSGVLVNSRCSLVVCIDRPPLNKIVNNGGSFKFEASIWIRVPTSTWSFLTSS